MAVEELPHSRAEAMALGLTRYFTGKPCSRGHIDIRYVEGHCRKCAYERTAERRASDPDRVNAAWRRFYAANRERRIAAVSKHQKENPEATCARSQNRRARKLRAEGSYTKDDVSVRRRLQSDKCAYCKVRLRGKGVIDHIVPLALGGSNWPNNLQLTCHSCNCKKGWKVPEQFSREQGMLL